MILANIQKMFRKVMWIITHIQREKATAILEFEVKELQNLFSLLLLGGFVGLPAPPTAITLELLPLMEAELATMTSRADFAQDPLGALIGMLNVD
ncbi:MAG: hypothetical protein N2Z76_04060 [Treponemataceae bacterium]|nr:hypothetical protein [Treponemataceae bacterium]